MPAAQSRLDTVPYSLPPEPPAGASAIKRVAARRSKALYGREVHASCPLCPAPGVLIARAEGAAHHHLVIAEARAEGVPITANAVLHSTARRAVFRDGDRGRDMIVLNESPGKRGRGPRRCRRRHGRGRGLEKRGPGCRSNRGSTKRLPSGILSARHSSPVEDRSVFLDDTPVERAAMWCGSRTLRPHLGRRTAASVPGEGPLSRSILPSGERRRRPAWVRPVWPAQGGDARPSCRCREDGPATSWCSSSGADFFGAARCSSRWCSESTS